MSIKNNLLKTLHASYPALSSETPPLDTLISEQLISPFVLELPKSILQKAEQAVADIFNYQKSHAKNSAFNPGNHAIAMSYDFHVSESGELKLIEINTNASFLLLSQSLYEAHGLQKPTSFVSEDLKKDILDEMELCFGVRKPPERIAIIDESPSTQKLYVEFLLYKNLFTSWGWSCEICDFRELKLNESSKELSVGGKKVDFIYNRFTDFEFKMPESQVLKKAFETKAACFSPNPHEYVVSADKERLIELGQTGLFPFVLKSEILTPENKDHIWEQRKNLFFKPLRSYGSKQSYKGSSISRKLFEELAPTRDILAQEYAVATEREFVTPEGPQSFKFDLRFYAYQNRLETAIARIYQGQVTNTRTPYGGFTCLRFV